MLKISKTSLLYGKTIIIFCCKDTCIFIDIFVEADKKPISISTHPLFPKNVVATNFTNLQLISSINHTSIITCWWYVSTDTSEFDYFFMYGCLEHTRNDIYRSTCEVADNFIKHNFTYLLPIRTTLYFEVSCSSANDQYLWNYINLFSQGKKKTPTLESINYFQKNCLMKIFLMLCCAQGIILKFCKLTIVTTLYYLFRNWVYIWYISYMKCSNLRLKQNKYFLLF